MDELALKAEKRDLKPKGKNNFLRRQGKIPAVVYGGSKKPIPLSIQEKDFQKAIHTRAGANAIIRLTHPEGTDTVILKSVHRHTVTHKTLHLDFQRISLKEKIEVRIPLRVVGEAPGVKLHGGILEHILRELPVRCLPTEIPDYIELDVSHLEIGHGISIQELKIPKSVEVLEKIDQVVVNVVAPTKLEEAPVAAPAAETLEPEVIARGKKEETTEAAPEKGAPAAPPPSPAKEKPTAK